MTGRSRTLRLEVALSETQRRIVAVLLLAIPLLLVATGLWSFVTGVVVQRERVTALKQEAATYDQLVRDFPLRRAEISRLMALPAVAQMFPPSSTAAATTRAQNAITNIIRNAGATMADSIVKTRTLPDSMLFEIREHVTITCDIGALTKVLYAMQNYRPGLFVDRITIQRTDVGRATGAENIGPQVLRTDMIISAYMRQS